MLYAQLITIIAKTIGVPASLLLAICTHESNLNNVMVPNDNGSPSYGLCQIKLETAQELGFRGIATGELEPSDTLPGTMQPKGNRRGLMIPYVNIRYAALYLKMQLERYDGDWCRSVAAYNSGMFIESKKMPGYPKNLKYVKKVVLQLDKKHKDFLICGPRKADE